MHYTLVYPIRQVRKKQEVLLGFMKDGTWQGYFNGFGGKILPAEFENSNVPKRFEGGESPAQCAIRELAEEAGMVSDTSKIEYCGHVLFNSEILVDIFVLPVDKKMDKAYNTESTKVAIPCWFTLPNLPYENMPPYDRFWLPYVLEDARWFHKFKLSVEKGEVIETTHEQMERNSGFKYGKKFTQT